MERGRKKRKDLIHSRLYQRACLFVSVFPIFIAIACWIDGTWKMPEHGKGLSQHYGYWSIFVLTPALCFLATHLLDSFLNVVREIETYCIELTEEMRARVGKLVERHIDSISLRLRSKWILVFLVVVLGCWWMFNVIKTISPLDTYHHDVFDAYAHPFGFYTAKVYVFLVFTLIYSIAVFVALHVTASMISILKFLSEQNILRINLFHSDNCGGTSVFGSINLMILGVYANFFAIDFAMYLTHRQTYLAIMASLAASSALAIVQSVSAVYYLHKAVAQKKTESIEAMTTRLDSQFALSLKKGGKFPSDLLALRNHILDIHTFPYAGGASIAINIIRFAPAALAVIAYFTK